jgi:hypothetical protein
MRDLIHNEVGDRYNIQEHIDEIRQDYDGAY